MSFSPRSRTARRVPTGGRGITALVGAAVLLFLAAYVWAPYVIQFVRFLYLSLPLLVLGGLAYFCWRRVQGSRRFGLAWLAATGLLVLYMIGTVYGQFAGGAQKALYDAVQPQVIPAPADTVTFRYTPSIIAQNRAKSAQLSSDQTRGDLDPLPGKDGITRWIAPLEPSGFLNVLFPNKTGQFVKVELNGELPRVNSNLNYVEGAWGWSDIFWQASWRAPLSDVSDDIYYVPVGKEEDVLAAVAPSTGYRLTRWFIFPVWIPVWNGDIVFLPNNQILSLPPEAAQSLLPEQRLVPESYARSIAESYGYRFGLNERILHNNGITEIPELEDNQMPFLVGDHWQTVVEPSGNERKNAEAVILTDHHTGVSSVVLMAGTESQAGPNAIIALMTGKLPNGQWNSNSLIEPVSFFHGGKLWYMATTTNTANKVEVANTVAMAASGGEPVWFANAQEVQAFLKGTFPGRRASTFLNGTDPVGGQPLPPVNGEGCSFEAMTGCSDQQLADLIRRAAEEQGRRLQSR